jgi:protein gp37
MATNTSIEWADKTWSPIIGCDRVSPGCGHCYAINTARIREANPNPKISAAFAGTTERNENGVDWTGRVNLLSERLDQPLHWKKPSRIFVNSMSDLFHDAVPDEHIVAVFARMWWSPQHTFQVLTKRHGRMRSLLPRIEERLRKMECDLELVHAPTPLTWPLPNVWLGVSVENQKWADIRIPALLETPAAVRFLSCEPLLGPVWISDHIWRACSCCDGEGHDEACARCADSRCEDGHIRQLDWVIVGGESGPKARAMHPDWARSLRDQCAQDHVPFFFKQWGEWGPAPFIVRVCDPQVGWQGTEEELAAAKADSEARGATHVHTGHSYVEDGERQYWLHEIGHKPWSLERCGLPEGTVAIRRWGKKRAGRELDGRTHDAFPGGAR